MGGGNSKPEKQEEQPSPFKDEAWRHMEQWDESTRNDFISHIKGFDPTPFNLQTFNIILAGQVAAGKSSFYNSINSIFDGFVRPTRAASGKAIKSFTKEYFMYKFRHNPRIRFGDSMGIQPDTSDVDIDNILCAAEGHVPNGYQFTDATFLESNEKYIKNPTDSERAHCVAIVINAKDVPNMRKDTESKLKKLGQGLIDRKIPIVVVLTHLDELHPEVVKDITKTFYSRPLEELVEKIHHMILGLPKNQIYPVINYNSQVHLNPKMDILLLYALRCMIAAAEDYLDIKMQREERQATTHASN